MSEYFSKCSPMGIIKHLKECNKYYKFSYNAVLLSECYVSYINTDNKTHITHRIDDNDNLISFLINSNNVKELLSCDNIYFYSQDKIMTILKGYARA